MTYSLHEASPGHHYHDTYISDEDNELPSFRRNHVGGIPPPPSTFPSYSAFTEGWGQYSEMLGHEMGLYNDPMHK